MPSDFSTLFSGLENEIVQFRRDVHNHAEVGHTEFWTTAYVVSQLRKWGYAPVIGEKANHRESRMGVPSDDAIQGHIARAISQGADKGIIQEMDGLTGCYVDLHPKKPALIALRFDIDANDLTECAEDTHRPAKEAFLSQNNGACHACGHDGHTAIGLGLAKILAFYKDKITHNVRLIFQPAEEGVRGAHSMVKAGVLDGVKFFLSAHLGVKALQAGELVCKADGFLATKKLDVAFKGVTSHAGMAPHEGKNSLLAAASAVMNLHAISRHGEGASRIAVGTLKAGEGRNVIPGDATMQIEVRGENSAINDYMYDQAIKILNNTAAMYDQEITIDIVGGCESATCDEVMGQLVNDAANKVPFFKPELRRDHTTLGGSEDASTMMQAVQNQGGIAGYALIGTELPAGHHHFRFDINETVLEPAVEMFFHAVLDMDQRAAK